MKLFEVSRHDHIGYDFEDYLVIGETALQVYNREIERDYNKKHSITAVREIVSIDGYKLELISEFDVGETMQPIEDTVEYGDIYLPPEVPPIGLREMPEILDSLKIKHKED